MYTLNISAYAYFNSQNFQVKYPVFVDDEMYSVISKKENYTELQTYEDLSMTVGPAIDRANSYLNARYLANHTEYYLHNPLDSSQPTYNLTTYINAYNQFGIQVKQIKPTTGPDNVTEIYPTQISLLNGSDLNQTQIDNMGRTASYDGTAIGRVYSDGFNSATINHGSYPETRYFTAWFTVVPSDYFVNDAVNPAYATIPECILGIRFFYDADIDLNITNVSKIVIFANRNTNMTMYKAFAGLDLDKTMPDIDDYSNPYSSDGTAGPGGGDGTLGYGGLDSIDPAEIPDLPTISAADLGFITMYNPTAAQLKSLSDFMWSNLFDLATYKKLFSDPMQSIIGLSIVPVAPSIGGSKNVHFGTIDSGISMSYLSTNYVQLDCGSVAVEKYVGCFMDNDPYTKISIYLPFVGIRQLSADDVIGGSIHVVYNIDVLTGACACFIEHSSRGVLYSYNGSCITNVPLTAVNFSGAIQNAVTAVGSAIGMAAGMATGAAPITAMSAVGLMTSAANTALNSKPSVQRSGNLGGSAGILSIMTPYVIIERPALSVPNRVQHFVGQTSNITMSLGNCKGFTLCEYVHIDNVSATTEEITEIESLLKQGVIL